MRRALTCGSYSASDLLRVRSHVADSLTISMSEAAYDRISRGYTTTRRADPGISAPIKLDLLELVTR